MTDNPAVKEIPVFGSTAPVPIGNLATSATSVVTVSTGTLSLVTQAGLPLKPTDRLRIASASGDWMEGAVSSYAGENLVVTVDKANGTGTHADWAIQLLGKPTDTTTGPVVVGVPGETKKGTEPSGDSCQQIPRRGALTIALVTTKGSSAASVWNSVIVPKDAEIGDVVEVYRTPDSTGPAVLLFPNVNESIGENKKSTGKNADAAVSVPSSMVLRKVSTSLWLVS